MQILKDNKTKEKRLKAIKENAKQLIITTLTIDDILASISYYLDILAGIGQFDNIDHLSNRRIQSVGELIRNAFRSGVNKLCVSMKESLQGKDLSEVTPSQIINPRPINKALKDFIASSQLSQLMDQANPLSSLTQKEEFRLLALAELRKKEQATKFVISTTPTLAESALLKLQKVKALVLSALLLHMQKSMNMGSWKHHIEKLTKKQELFQKLANIKWQILKTRHTLLNQLNH